MGPQCLTKELQIQTLPNQQRKIRISTNFLPLFGFAPGTRLEGHPHGGGFDLLPSSNAEAPWKVHQRRYTNRRNTRLAANTPQTKRFLKSQGRHLAWGRTSHQVVVHSEAREAERYK